MSAFDPKRTRRFVHQPGIAAEPNTHPPQVLDGLRCESVALGALKARARRIFESRRLAEDPMTLAELANEFGVSRERVRQIEARAFEKVQKIMNGVATIEMPAQKPMH